MAPISAEDAARRDGRSFTARAASFREHVNAITSSKRLGRTFIILNARNSARPRDPPCPRAGDQQTLLRRVFKNDIGATRARHCAGTGRQIKSSGKGGELRGGGAADYPTPSTQPPAGSTLSWANLRPLAAGRRVRYESAPNGFHGGAGGWGNGESFGCFPSSAGSWDGHDRPIAAERESRRGKRSAFTLSEEAADGVHYSVGKLGPAQVGITAGIIRRTPYHPASCCMSNWPGGGCSVTTTSLT
ncbi:hypothetical protein AAFF_G00130060 [Aldrovandia affinis]|uniref:Uncharacterized protein n=1 Tax=Aldrovandia affinis TaxID=143900 RepID=A0AAD7RRG9_9TELE|nr:hypothetical protein AAFF_G00130060 [Aldrovandia affinis]